MLPYAARTLHGYYNVFWTNNPRSWDVRLKKSDSAEVRAVVPENAFNPQVSIKMVNVEEQLHKTLRQIDGRKELLWLLGPEPERSEENLLDSVEELFMSEDYSNGKSKKQFWVSFSSKINRILH